MVREAELYKDQDEENKGKIEAKNLLENYLYSMRNNIKDEKIPEDVKTTINNSVDEGLKWLEDNQNEAKSVYEDKMKEIQDKLTPLMGGAAGAASGMPAGFDPSQFAQQAPRPPPQAPPKGPSIEEVD